MNPVKIPEPDSDFWQQPPAIGVHIGAAIAYYTVMPAPEFQAQLDRIEAMLKALTDLPHNKRYDQQPLAEQPK